MLKNRFRKSLSVLLAVCLIAGMIPDAVFAQEDAGAAAAEVTTEAASEAVAASEETGAAEAADTGEAQTEASKTETEATPSESETETTKAETETTTDASKTETEAAAETDQSETESATEAASKTETEAATEASKAETEAATEASKTETETATEASMTETEATKADETSTETESETAQETETETMTEAETETETVSTETALCDHGNDADTCVICKVEALIDELPGVDEIAQMDAEEQNDVYTQASDICDIYYDELTEDEQEQVSNIGELWEILDYFSGVVSLTATAGTECGDFYVTDGELGTDFTYADNVLTFTSGGEYTVTMKDGTTSTSDDRIVVSASGDITLTLSGIDVTSSSASPLEVNTSEAVTILLSGTNVLTSTASGYAGLQKTSTANTLTITSANGSGSTDGSLTATGGNYAAGIGGGSADGTGADGSNITISGGTITATGGGDYGGAGIGGGGGSTTAGSGTGITIAGGTVTANGGGKTTTTEGSSIYVVVYGGAGIGGGGSTAGGSGTDITITGGTVAATGGGTATVGSSSGYAYGFAYGGAGIGGGGGSTGGAGMNIAIKGGAVEASGGGTAAATAGSSNDIASSFGIGGAGIGGGGGNSPGGNGTNITIENSEVTATGGGEAAAEKDGSYYKTYTANSNGNGGAGIGGGGGNSIGGTGDTITIKSGTVTATGGGTASAKGSGSYSYGVGGAGAGGGGSCGGTSTGGDGINIKITGGTVTATGGGTYGSTTYGGAGIGGGGGHSSGGTGSDIAISGGYILATAGSGASAIGGGKNGTTGTVTITGGYYGTGSTTANTVYDVEVAAGYGVAANTDSDTKGTYPVYVTTQATCGDFVVTSGGTLGTDFTYTDNVLTFLTGGEYIVSMNTAAGVTATTTDRIVVSADSDITLTLDSIDVTSSTASPLEVNTSAAVTIALSGTNVLTSTADEYAGLQKTSTANTLIITSANGDGFTDGSLTATGGDYAAGIGGGYCGSGTGITISGGTVTASSGQYGAGIGGGAVGSGTNITIDGGTVTAIGGGGIYGGAGIGGGYQGSGTNITIDGGTVIATGGGTYGGAGIGGGFNGNGSDITITDSEVTATGGGTTNDYFTTYGGAGIGGGYNGSGSNITIMGSTVTATGGGGDTTSEYYYGGAGIGGGYGGSGSGITITDSEVTATGGTYGGAGIGGGWNGSADGITISSGYILATAGSGASTIGGGENGSTGTITITGGCFGTGVLADSTDPVGTVYTIAPAIGYCVESNTEDATKATHPYLVTVCTYTVTLESNGGKITDGSEVTSYVYGIGATLPDSDSISREGYTFGGWYEESDFSGSAVTGIGTSDYGNKTYYACWICPHNSSYSYNVSDVASENSKVLTATCLGCGGTLTYTLAAPEESGLTYDGNSHNATVSLGEEDALYSYASDTSTVLPKTLTITYSYSDTESGTKESVSETKAAGYYTASITLGGVTASVSYQVSQASISKSDFTVDTDGETYTGSAITKTITSSLTEGTDYSVTYADNTNAGTATITITGSGNYTGELIYSFTINKKELTASINGTTSKVYDGTTAVTDDQNLSVTLDGVVAGDIVSVVVLSYAYDTASVGTDKTITASGLTLSGSDADNYTLADTSVTVSGSITAKEITVTITPNGGTYGGTITAATATLNGVITADEDNVPVTLTYTGTANDEITEYNGTEVPTLAGTYTVTATISDANYSLTGTTTAEFVVEKAAPTITLSDSTAVYNGEAVAYGDVAAGAASVGEAAVTLVNGETYDAAINGAITYTYYTDEDCTILTGSEDETASGAAGEGAAPINAGTYYVKASIGEQDNYTAAVSTAAKLTIEPKAVELTWSMLTESELVYDGSAKTLTASVSNLASGDEVSVTVALTDGTDNVNVTEDGFSYIATALTGADSGNYCLPDDEEDKTSATYYITSAELTSASVEQSGTLTYDGTAQTAEVTASAATVDGTDDDITFTYSMSENGEYTASVSAFTNAGTYTVYYRAEAANYETVSGSFTVTIAAKSVTASISGTTEKTYDGTTDTTTDQGLSIELSGVVDGDTVTAAATGYAYNSADVVSASTITATGITLSGEDAGNYTLSDDTATVAGSITARTLSESDFTVDTDEETYSGSAITKTIVGSLAEDTDYTVTYANNTSAGTATITITGTGNYTGSLIYDFTIEPKEITVSISGTTGNVYGGTITAATATLDGVTDADEGNVDVTLTYTGTANDGTEYESTEVPTLAGTYTVTATISDSNYSLTGTTTAEFVIAKATYDMSGVSFADATYTYDGTEKTLTITGSESLPDGVTVSYTDNSLTDAGSIEVTATFSGDADNYEAIESKTATLTIIKADFILTVTGYEGVYDEDAHSITVTAEDGVTVTYSAAEDSGFSEENLAYTDAGTYTVYYKASKANYNDVTGSATVVITQAEGEGSVSITGWTYGDYDADTNSPVSTSSTNGTDSVTYLYKVQGADDSTYTDEVPTDAGSYTVQATFAETNNYKAVTATADFTIAKAASGLSVGVDLELDKTYGDDAFALSAVWTDTANATATYESSDTSVATVSEDGTVTIVGIGAATITASVHETDNYNSGSVGITLTVEKKDSTLTVTEVAYEVTYGDASFNLEVTSEGGTVTYTSSDEDVVTVDSDGNVTITGAGEATITLSIADGDNYNGTSTTVTVKVNEAALKDVSVEQDGTLTYDGTAQTAAVKASAETVDGTDDDVTFTYSTSENGEYTTEVPAFTDAGTYTVYYRAEAANHEAVSGSFTVTIAAKSVTASISGTTEKTYDGTTDTTTDQGLSIELSGVVDGDTVTATATGYAYNSAEVESADTITATDITLSGEDAGNYTLSDDTATVAGSITAKALSESDFTVDTDEETYSGSAITKTIAGSLTADTDYTVTYANNTNAGTASITIAGTGNYTGSLTYEFTIEPKEITVSISGTTGNVYGGTITAATATLDGVTDDDAGSVEVILTYTGTANDGTEYESTEVPTLAGTYTVTATISDSNYSLTGTTTADFTVGRAASGLSVGVDLTLDKTYGDEAFAMSATWTDTANATATYASDNTDIATVDDDGTVTIVGAGTATITVSVSESANYNSGSVEITLTVEKKDSTLTVAEVAYEVTYGDDPFNLEVTSEGGTVTYTSSDEDVATVDSDGNVTITGAGEATITLSIADGDNYNGTSKTVTVKVNEAALTDASVEQDGTLTYDGTAQTAAVTASAATVDGTDDDVTFTYSTSENGEYSAAVPAFTDAGTYTVYYRAEAANHETVSGSFTVTIAAKSATVSISGTTEKTYDGTTDTTTDQGLSIELSGVVEGDDVTASATSYTYDSADVDSASTITATGITLSGEDAGNYMLSDDTATVAGCISARTLSESDFTVDTDEETYSGSAITKTIVSSLTEDTDYAVTYANNTNAGTATITIAGTGNYTGSLTNEFIIEPKEITVSISGTTGNVYGGTITAATATLDGVTDADEGNVDVTLTYTGTANDGTEYESTEVPTLAGTYTVTATISDSNYSLTGTTTAEFVIAKATYDMSGVSFADATYTYDGTEKTLTITGSESLPDGVTVSYTDNSLTDAGSIEVTATFSGDVDNYEAIESKTATLTIIKADFILTVTGYEGVYDEDAHSITVTAEDGVTVTYSAAEDSGFSEENLAYTDAGTYTVYYKASKANYNDVTGSATVVITQAEGEGSVSITGWTYGDYDADTNSPVPVSATNGTEDVTYLYKVQDADDSTYTSTVPTDAGSYTVQATFAATNNYKAGTATADFTIAKAASGLSVGVDLELDKTYGDDAFALSAVWTDTANATATYESSDTSVAAVSDDGTVTIVGAGTATITVSVSETDNYSSGSVEITLTVEKKDSTLTVTEAVYEVTYGDASFTLEVTSEGGTVTYTSSDEDVATVDSDGNVTITGAGEATITLSIADGDNYNGTSKTVTVKVNEAALTDASVEQDGTLTYDGTAQTAAVTASAATVDGTDDDVTFTYSTSENGEYSTEVPAFTDAGTYTVYYRAEAANHETVSGSFTVTIAAKSVTVSISGTTEKTYDGTTDTTTDQGLSIELSGVVDGDTVTATATGYAYNSAEVESADTITATDITLSGEDAGNYTLSDDTATVAGSITARTLRESDFTVDTDEETYSGSAITKTIVSSLTEDTDYAVTYANNTNAGTATITIAGTGNYTGSLTNEFIIEPKEITVSISGTTGNVYGGMITAATATLDGVTDADEGNVDVTLTYTGTANDGTEYESTEVPTLAGTYTVTATISDSNYSLTGTTTAEFVIAKATYDMSGVSFADATYTYDGTEKTLTITGSESLPEGVTVSYTDNSLTDVGSIEVTAAFSGDANNYEAIESKTATLTIINADFTVTVTGYEGVYDGEEHSITVIAEDGVTVTYCYSKDATEGEEETDGGEGEEETDAAEDEDGSEDDKEYTVLNPAFTDAGTYTVYYKASKANYNDVTGSVTVVITQAEGEGSVSITGWIYGEYDADTNSLAPVSATNGTDDVTYLYKTQGADDSTYTDEVPTDAGSYTVQATFAATNNYKAVTATADFTIAKAASGLSVGVDLELDKTYGDEAFALSATWTDTENAAVTYVSSDTSVAVVSEDGTVTIVGAGTAIITVSVPETDNCTSGSVEITLTVEKKDNTLTVTEVAYEVTYGDDLFTLDVTSKGGTVTYVSSDEDVVTVDENGTVTIVGVGEATISISIADSDNYNGTETTVTVTVNEAALTDVSVAQTGTLTYDGTTQTAAVTASAKTADGTDADVTFTYSTSEDGEYSTEIPAFTDAGTYTVYYRAEAANHETVEGSFTVTINKATYDMSGVSFEDATFEYDGGEKTLEISGTLPDGVTVTYSGNTLTEAGSITAIATFTGDMDNYGAIDLMMATLTITVLVELPEQTFPDEDAVHKVEVQEGLSEVPEALKENPDLDTVEEIEALLKTEVTAAEGYTTENSTVYNVTLMISFDGGLTWTKATAENFPADGLQVLLPYPEGTGKDTHDFVVTHMFTTTDFGKTPGETETPTVTKTDDGLVVTVTGLSPITIAWKEIGTESETESETAAQSETTAQSETQTESETAVQSETQTESETETKSETTAQSETETESQTAAAELESGTESPVQTGDETPISMWLTLFLLSAAALLMMGERKRQKR